MKVNVRTLTPIIFMTMVEHFIDQCDSKCATVLEVDWRVFANAYLKMFDKLNMIMPANHQKGLKFKITNGVGDCVPDDYVRSVWVTIERGSKDWFITGIECDRPAVTSIHPVNFTDDMERLYSIIERVTQPAWFNEEVEFQTAG